jgi:periplasmic protein TonB
MSDLFAEEFRESWTSRLKALAVPGAILFVIVGAILYFLHDTAGIRREAPPLPTLVATLPPPPPPPPPPKQQPEVEKKIEEPKPVDQQPKTANSAPKTITEAGPAQAGSDAFGIQAGSGDGDVGSGGGFGDANYTRYLGSALQQTIQNDDRINHQVFTADMAVWVNPDGRVTRATVLKSSGDPKIDEDLVTALQDMPALDEPPPTDLEFPQRVRIEGRRRA